MDLPSPDDCRGRAKCYLAEHQMMTATRLLGECELKVDPVGDAVSGLVGWNIRLRCVDETFDQLKKWDGGMRQLVHLQPLQQLEEAFKAALAGTRTVDAEWVKKREATWLIRAIRKRVVKRPRKSKRAKRVAQAKKPVIEIVTQDGPDGRRFIIGRFAYVPGFYKVWVDGELFDLSRRRKARACLQYLVESGAFDEASAKHLVTEINPYVRKQCRLRDLSGNADIRILHYFNPKNSAFDRLQSLLIQRSGRNGFYYLRVQ